MLADFLTMHESSHRPYDAITYTYMGDAHSNGGRSLLVIGATALRRPDLRTARAVAAARCARSRGVRPLAPYQVIADARDMIGSRR